MGDARANILDGGAGNDTLTGNGGNDTFVFGRGYGQDVINNTHYDSGQSVLRLNAATALPSDVVAIVAPVIAANWQHAA
ncbi:hypothetical protein WCLP8_4620002 [uncultured Gammaproteobacteria bacterium]